MKANQIELGHQVVLNDAPDATVYTVVSLPQDHQVQIIYKNERTGEAIHAGSADVSSLIEA